MLAEIAGSGSRAYQATLFTVVGCLWSLGLLATGVVQLTLGHLIGLAPALTFALPAAAITGLLRYNRRALESEIAALVAQVNEVLGTTGAVKT
jgi:hypothetical protein